MTNRLLLTMGCLVTLSMAVYGQMAATVPATAPANPLHVDFPTFGLSLTAPKDWQRVPEASPGQVARWIKPDGSGKNAAGVLAIELSPAGKSTLEQFAADLAAKANAKFDKKLSVSGQEALVLTSDSKAEGMHASMAIVAADRGRFCIISAMAAGPARFDAELAALAASIKWIEIESPAKHLEFMPNPALIFDNLAGINIPAIMRPVTASPDRLSLAVVDFSTGAQPFTMTLEKIGKEPQVTAEQVQQVFARRLDERLQAIFPGQWVRVESGVPVFLSEPMELALPQSNVRTTLIYGVAVPSPTTALLATFTFNVPAAQQDPYRLAAIKIMASLRPVVVQTTQPATATAPATSK